MYFAAMKNLDCDRGNYLENAAHYSHVVLGVLKGWADPVTQDERRREIFKDYFEFCWCQILQIWLKSKCFTILIKFEQICYVWSNWNSNIRIFLSKLQNSTKADTLPIN